MPLIVLDSRGELENTLNGRNRKWVSKSIILDPDKDYEIGLRFVSMTVNSDTQANADEEFSFPYMLRCNLVKRTDYLLTRVDQNPVQDRIASFIDLNEATPELTGTQSQRNAEFKSVYFTDMEHVQNYHIETELLDICGDPYAFANAASDVIESTFIFEYREKRK